MATKKEPPAPEFFTRVYSNAHGDLFAEKVGKEELRAWIANNDGVSFKLVGDDGDEYEPVHEIEFRRVGSPEQKPSPVKKGRPKGTKNKPKATEAEKPQESKSGPRVIIRDDDGKVTSGGNGKGDEAQQ